MKNKTALIHVGSHKTGTNSIQWFLKENRRELLRHDILVPTTGANGRGAHHALAWALCNPGEDHGGTIAELAREIADNPTEAILISSETLEGRLLVRKSADAFFANLAALNLEPRIVLFLRNQPKWINSRYSQLIKSFKTGESFAEFVHQTMDGTHSKYSAWINLCRVFTVDLLARPYTTAVARRGIIPEFVAALGLDRSAFGALDTRRNVSAGPFTVSVAREALARISGGQRLTHFQAVRCKSLLTRHLKAHRLADVGYCGLTSELAREIELRCGADNDKFSMSAWGAPWGTVFAADVGLSFEPNDHALIEPPAETLHLIRTATEDVCTLLAPIMDDPSLRTDPAKSLTDDDRKDRSFWE